MDDDGEDLVALDLDDPGDAGDPGGGAGTSVPPAGWRGRAASLGVVAALGLSAVGVATVTGDDAPPEEVARSAPSTTTSTTTANAARDEPATTSTTAPFASESTGGRRLLFLDGSTLLVADLDANTTSTRQLPLEARFRRFDLNGGSIVVTGPNVFLSDGSRAVRLSPELRPDEQPRIVGESLVTLRSARAGRVWLTQRRGETFVVLEVDGSGRVTTPPRALPADAVPSGAAGDAGLVLTRGAEILVWHPVRGEIVWQSPPNVTLLGVVGTSVIWQRYCEGAVCSFHVTDAPTGTDRTYAVGGQLWQTYPTRLTFSAHPQGRMVTASMTPNDPSGSTQLVFLDVRTGARFSVPTQLGSPVWSPGGDWVFLFGGNDSPDEMHVSGAVRVDRVEDGHFRVVTLRLPPQAAGTAVAVL